MNKIYDPEIAAEALAMLRIAEQNFDQACSLLQDAGLYEQQFPFPMLASRHWITAKDLNMKFIPALINGLERQGAE